MDRQHEASDVAPDALEQELRAAINTEPSAFYLTRVRATVASESMSRRWWAAPRLVAGLVGAVLLVVGATMWLMWARGGPGPPAVATVAVPGRALPPQPPDAATAASDPSARVVPPVQPVASDPATRAVPPRRDRAVIAAGTLRPMRPSEERFGLAWLEAVDRGLVTVAIVSGPDWPQEASLSTPLVVPPLAIAPVTVAPIAPFAE